MNGFLIFILGAILLNSLFSLIPTFFPEADPGIYISYQSWFNVLLIFNWLLPKKKAKYLFEKDISMMEGKVNENIGVMQETSEVPEAIEVKSESVVLDKSEIPEVKSVPSVPPIEDENISTEGN